MPWTPSQKKEYFQTRYHLLLSEGRCVICKKKKGKSEVEICCRECRLKKSEQNRAYYLKKKALLDP